MPTLAAGIAAAPTAHAAGGLVYETSKLKPLPAGAQVSAKAKCPNDTSVLGGGVEISDANTATGIASSHPIDDGDTDKRPDDGWVGVANSRSAGDKAVRATAVCSKSGSYSYVVRQELLLGPGALYEYAVCPVDEQVAGGGASLSLGSTSTYLAASAPGGDMFDPPAGEGWSATAVTQDATLMRVYSICARSGSYRVVTEEGSVAGGAQAEVAAGCPGKRNVTSGGGFAGGAVDAELALSGPYGDDMGKPDDGWQVAANNHSGTEDTTFAYAVCRI